MLNHLKPAFVLLLITFSVTFSVALVNHLTEDVIRQRTLSDSALRNQLSLPGAKRLEILPEENHGITYPPLVEEVYAGYNRNALVGYVIKTRPTGYGGPMEVTVGILKDGTLSRVILGENTETPGLGTLAGTAPFIDQYTGLSIQSDPFLIVKGKPEKENEIEALTGATQSARALNAGVEAARRLALSLLNEGGS
jgi:Na+-translocating ferredoxin:NAD+ oxidoreductase subunit G